MRDKLRQGDTMLGICYNSAVVVAMMGAFYVEVSGDFKKDEMQATRGNAAENDPETTSLPASQGDDKHDKRSSMLTAFAKFRSGVMAILTKITRQANGRHLLCIGLWWCSQAFRSALMPALRGNAAALSGERAGILLTSFVLVDKFVGPLGVAALDTALLWLISHGSSMMDTTSPETKGGVGSVLLPSTLLWAIRSGSEKVERPFIQSVILSMSEGKRHTFAAPSWVAPVLASMTAGTVMYVLQRSGVMAMGSMVISSAASATGAAYRRMSGSVDQEAQAPERGVPGGSVARKSASGSSSSGGGGSGGGGSGVSSSSSGHHGNGSG